MQRLIGSGAAKARIAAWPSCTMFATISRKNGCEVGLHMAVMRLIALLVLVSLPSLSVSAQVDRPQWQLNDTWRYRLTILPNANSPGTFTSEHTLLVTAVKADHYVLKYATTGASNEPAKNQRWSLDLNRLHRVGQSDMWAQFSRLQWPLAEHARWQAKYVNPDPDTNTVWNAAVVGWERIEVPAGTFDTVKIQLDRTSVAGAMGGKRETLWYAPAVKRHVRFEQKQFYRALVVGHYVEELVDYHVNEGEVAR